MGSFVRSYLTIGVATVTAATIAFVPSVKEPAAVASDPQVVQVASPPIKLAALVQPSVTATNLPDLVFEWLQRVTVPPSAGAAFPTPQLPPVVVGNSVSSVIKNTYNAVEPWVQWGFEVAAYAVGWVPYVGWLAPQINIFYNFGEQIVRSITFNVADWIGGQISFVQGLSNVGVDTVNAFIYLANAQLAFWLPPLPPIPPIRPFAAVDSASTLGSPIEALSAVGPVDGTEMKQDPGLAHVEADVEEGDQAVPVDGDQTVVNAEDLGAGTEDVTITTEDVKTETEALTPAEIVPAESTPSVENVEPAAAGNEVQGTPPSAKPVTTPATEKTPKSPPAEPVRAHDRTGNQTHERGTPGDTTADPGASSPQKHDRVDRPLRGERPDTVKRSGEKAGHDDASNDSAPKRTTTGAGRE
ncbi:hypothetical protein [Mycobacterium sp. URHB0021]